MVPATIKNILVFFMTIDFEMISKARASRDQLVLNPCNSIIIIFSKQLAFKLR
jgi:hypothetical protein